MSKGNQAVSEPVIVSGTKIFSIKRDSQKGLTGIHLYFGTYSRKVMGTLTVTFYMGTFRKSFKIMMDTLRDNDPHEFTFGGTFYGDKLDVHIRADYRNSLSPLAVWTQNYELKHINIEGAVMDTALKKTEGAVVDTAPKNIGVVPPTPVISVPKTKEKKFTVGIVTALHKVPLNMWTHTVASVKTQICKDWVWYISVDTGENLPYAYMSILKDPRIVVINSLSPKGISGAQNEALAKLLQEGKADWFFTLDHDDMITSDAVKELGAFIQKDSSLNMVYTDEDHTDILGKKYEGPFYKPDWSPAQLLCQNYICHLCAYKTSWVKGNGVTFNSNFDGSQDHKFLLDLIRDGDAKVGHIPKVLYHWRIHGSSTSHSSNSANKSFQNGMNSVKEYLGDKLSSISMPALGVYRPVLKVSKETSVRIVIPSKDHPETVETCLKSLQNTLDPNGNKISFQEGPTQLVIVDNGSADKTGMLSLYNKYTPGVEVLYDKYEFNFAKQSNLGAKGFEGDYLLFLNNDTEMYEFSWLNEMRSWMDNYPDIAVVGARLYYGNNTLQHGEVAIGVGGIAAHMQKGLSYGQGGYYNRALCVHEVSAVTGACMLVRRSVFEEVGGFDENLPRAYNDVDFCLKVRKAGHRQLYTPWAEMKHHESVSRGIDTMDNPFFKAATQYILKKWPVEIQEDPYLNINFSRGTTDYTPKGIKG